MFIDDGSSGYIIPISLRAYQDLCICNGVTALLSRMNVGAGSSQCSNIARESFTIGRTPATATLTVKKVVVGGGKPASDFQIQVAGNNPKPSAFSGSTTGTDVTLRPGTYKVTETPVDQFFEDFSKDCSGVIKPNEHKTCTITNIPVGPPET